MATRSDSLAKTIVAFVGAPIVGGFRVFVLRFLYLKMELALPTPGTSEVKNRVITDSYVFQHPALDSTKNTFYTCCYSERELREMESFYTHLNRKVLDR